MALTFPLDLAAEIGSKAITSAVHGLTEARENHEQGSGQIRSAEYGPRLWFGSVTIRRLPHVEAEEILAVLRALQHPRASFLISPIHMGKINAPGAKLDAVRNGRELRISGLPNNLPIRRGTFLSFTYGTNPVRHALHQITEAGTASGTGLSPYLEVEPAIRAGYTAGAGGASIELSEPQCKAVLVPGSLRDPSLGGVMAGNWSFDWRQTL